MLRKCTKCGIEKPFERFVRQTGKYRPDPYRQDCKDCKNEKRRKGTISQTRFKKGQASWNKGLPADPKVIKKMIESRKGQEVWNKGKLESKRRFSRLYKQWRDAVKHRDGNKCQKCGSEKSLHAHHVKPWKEFEKLRFDIDNGLTICQPCHAKLEGYQKGHRQSEKAREKMSIAKKGKEPWNKGLKYVDSSE